MQFKPFISNLRTLINLSPISCSLCKFILYTKMKKFELIFIPMPGTGHLASMVEMANLLVARDHRLVVTILAMKLPFDAKANEHLDSFAKSNSRHESIRFIFLELPIPEDRKDFVLKVVMENCKPLVREVVTKLNINHIAGFVLDMFCTTMTDLAKEFKVPCYVYYTSGAGFLSLCLHLEELYSQNNNSNEVVEQLKNSDVDLAVQSLVNPIPSKVIPGIYSIPNAAVWFHEQVRRLRTEVNGILINTFEAMESHLIDSFSRDSSSSRIPPLYAVGPVLHLKDSSSPSSASLDRADILKWLDDQAPSSVVFLCFGSKGSFDKDQVEEIARALEQSGVRFVWCLRQPPPKGDFSIPSDYENVEEVLPEGFLERTKDNGRVIGWAPQVEILAHPATGGFVSHCGWNSTLESMWHGVPMATWPVYAEQQFNAFEMVVELGLAVEISIDYRKEYAADKPRLVSAEKIMSGINKLMMDNNNEIRKKVKALSEESKKSVMEGGSSFIAMSKFIDDVLANSPLGGGD